MFHKISKISFDQVPGENIPPEGSAVPIDKKRPGRGVKELTSAIEKELQELHREIDVIEELIDRTTKRTGS